MEIKPFIEGERIYLREVRLSDVNGDYYSWMNDNEVTQYTESRFYPYSREKIENFITKIEKEGDSVFLAIIVKEGDKHIGNIKIGPINWIHRFADVGIIIGERTCWGKGFGTEAIRLVVDYAFNKLNLHKLTAGCYVNNPSSIRAFKKAGFIEEGTRTKQYFYKGEWVDGILLGILNQKSG
ncbi:MAG: GNAT family protein [bacterium]